MIDVTQAYATCRAMTREHARNFYYGFVLLPEPRRSAIYALYAFARRADDAVDEAPNPQTATDGVHALRGQVTGLYAGDIDPHDAVLVALGDAVRRFGIPRRHLDDLLDGMEMDIVPRAYPTSHDLERYCRRVASAPGLASLEIFGYSDERAPYYAGRLGVAMQLVNIIRDVDDDAARGRIYLPRDEMRAAGVTPEDILARRFTPALADVLAAQARRARRTFAEADHLLPLLDAPSRACVRMLGTTYRAILDRIESRGYDVFAERVSIATSRKLALMARSAITARFAR